ncbi:MAG: DUF6722 family protein [bacterium]
MNNKQRESTAKYIYDVSKIIFATVVIGQFVQKDIHLGLLISGIMATIITYLVAFLVERR